MRMLLQREMLDLINVYNFNILLICSLYHILFKLKLEKNLKYVAGQANFTELLSSVPDLSSRVILLYAR